MISMPSYSRFLAIALCAAVLAGCAAGGGTKPAVDEETVLRERAERYWAAREAQDLQTIYELESAALPAGGGWLTPYVMGQRGAGLPIEDVVVGAIKIDGDRAEILVSADVTVPGLGVGSRQTIKDPWLKLDGQWYHETWIRKKKER